MHLETAMGQCVLLDLENNSNIRAPSDICWLVEFWVRTIVFFWSPRGGGAVGGAFIDKSNIILNCTLPQHYHLKHLCSSSVFIC